MISYQVKNCFYLFQPLDLAFRISHAFGVKLEEVFEYDVEKGAGKQ